MDEAIAQQTGRQLEPRPTPPPEPPAQSLIPKPNTPPTPPTLPTLDKRSTLPTLSRRNIALPDRPIKPQAPSSQKDIYSVIDVPRAPRSQPKPPRMLQSLLPGHPFMDSREEDEDERCSSVGSDLCQPDEDSLVYSKVSRFEEDYEEVPDGRDQDRGLFYKIVSHDPASLRRTLDVTQEDRAEEGEEEEEEEEEKKEMKKKSEKEGRGSHVITTSSDISVNFRQTLANILFKDLAKVQIQPTLPTESIDSDAAIYQNHLDM